MVVQYSDSLSVAYLLQFRVLCVTIIVIFTSESLMHAKHVEICVIMKISHSKRHSLSLYMLVDILLMNIIICTYLQCAMRGKSNLSMDQTELKAE